MEYRDWLNLREAADLASCSRKTLYRYMAKGVLEYRKETNNRRYVQRQHIEALFTVERSQKTKSLKTLADLTEVVNWLEKLSADIEAQSALLERMIALYKPKTLAELVSKRKKYDER